MIKRYFLLLVICFSSLILHAQRNGSVSGIAYDTLAKKPVAMATVTLLLQKDSSLVSFTMTDEKGRFEMTGLGNAAYQLIVSHVNYHTSVKTITLNDDHKKELIGELVMNDRKRVLEEVTVQNSAPPVTLVGDTIQYNAGSFKTAPNANVEELLKKLPGVKVEKDGSIKAQGEKVQKVLVDGKEFFGNDPKMATKNLPADAVDKVQVYDKMSDQAQLTGFDDGNSEKTINLKLKKDKKKGAFGKIYAGGGNDGKYEGRFNVNSFKGARQLSVIGMGNNTNTEGFSFMDVLNFTGAMNQLKNGGGNININISDDDPLAGLLGANKTGINKTFGGGINYNNIIGNKTDLQSNYFYSRYNPVKETQTQRQYFLPDSFYYYDQDAHTNNLTNTHRVNLVADYQIDSFHSIKISPSFSYQQTSNESWNDYKTYSAAGAKSNDGNSRNSITNEGGTFSNSILFRKRFHRRGRTFSVNLLTNLNSSTGDGRLISNTNFYNPSGFAFRKDSLNQLSNSSADLKGFNVRAVYTEPIFKRSLLEFSVGRSYTENNSRKDTWDYNASNGKFDLVNNLLSNDYENSYAYTTTGMRLRKQRRKYNYAVGLTWQHANLDGKTAGTGNANTRQEKDFYNILPNARFEYKFSQFKSMNLMYTTNTNQPSITQLQPVPDNTNPLYIKEGNPSLKQEFSHNVRMHVSWVNPFKNRNIFGMISFQQTQNKIVNYDRINALGIDSVRYVNVNGVYNVNADITRGTPLRLLKAYVEIGVGLNYNKGTQFINTKANEIRTVSLIPEISFSTALTKKISLELRGELTLNHSSYSLNSSLNAKYLRHDYSASLDWEMNKGFFFSTDFNYIINNQYNSGFNTKIPLWNASFSKQVLKFKRGQLKLSVNDLLNKNIGISRSSNQNYVEDTRVNTIRRFFLLGFTYSLSKVGLNDAGSGGARVIMR